MKYVACLSFVLFALSLAACAPEKESSSSLPSTCMSRCADSYMDRFDQFTAKDSFHCEFDHCPAGEF